MTKKFRFGNDYLDQYGKKVFKVKRHRGNRPPQLIFKANKHRDAQQWAYIDKG